MSVSYDIGYSVDDADDAGAMAAAAARDRIDEIEGLMLDLDLPEFKYREYTDNEGALCVDYSLRIFFAKTPMEGAPEFRTPDGIPAFLTSIDFRLRPDSSEKLNVHFNRLGGGALDFWYEPFPADAVRLSIAGRMWAPNKTKDALRPERDLSRFLGYATYDMLVFAADLVAHFYPDTRVTA